MQARAAHVGFSRRRLPAHRRARGRRRRRAADRPDPCRCSAAWPASGCCCCSPVPSSRTCATATALREVAPAVVCASRSWPATSSPCSERRDERAVPVVIVGAGPTGLTAATLLGQYGVECLVLERWEAVYPQPRAVHLDDEIYRILGPARARRASSPRSPGRATGCGCSTGTCGCWPSSAAPPRPAGTATPRRTCSTSPSWRGSCARTSTRHRDRHPPRQRRGHRRSPRTAPVGCASTSPTGSPAGPSRSSPSTSWAATAPTA